MPNRFNFIIPAAWQLLSKSARRLSPGGLAASLPEASSSRPLVIVTGSGRSGTSVAARVLHESGVRMGREFDPPTEFNVEGYYEDVGVRMTNEQILTAAGMIGTWRSLKWQWRSTLLAIGGGFRGEMEEQVAGALEGWKDPRFCITLEAWLPHLPCPPKVIVCLRGPDAYVDSVANQFGIVDRGPWRRHWAQLYRRLLDVIRDYRIEATCLDFDALLEDPEGEVARLSEFVGHPLRADLVNPPLRRFRHPVPERYAGLYREVLALGGDAPRDFPIATGSEMHERTARRWQEAIGDEDVATIETYVRRVEEIDAGLHSAKAIWTVRIGLPRPKLAEFERFGLSLQEAMDETRSACREYAKVTREWAEELEALTPPPGFEQYHELTCHSVNLERLTVGLFLTAAEGEEADALVLKRAVSAWRQFGRGSVFEKAQERRRDELARALEASGYVAARTPASAAGETG